MPIIKVRGGYKVGRGKKVYRTKKAAKAANRAAHARKFPLPVRN